jgi:crossover junction endodeoxyribonuclease RusA
MREIDVRELCHWRQGLVSDVTHQAFHFGALCPYDVVAAVLAGQPDPRDDIAVWHVDISGALTIKGAVPLTLNDRGMHWAAHAKAVARVKAVTRNAVMAADIPHLDHVHVEMHYRPKTNRFRDVDNTVATLKVAIDALHHRDTSENAPVPFDPIVDGDDPRYVTWSPPVLHPAIKGQEPALWLVLSSAMISGPRVDPGEQLAVL